MNYLTSFLLLATLSFFVGSCTHKEKKVVRDIASLQAAGGAEGIWFLQGTSSTLGPYNGELELRKASDGTFDVVRVVTYINYFFDGLKVQEVWTGKALAQEDSLTVSYNIRHGDFIARLDDQKREPADFRDIAPITARFFGAKAGLQTRFKDQKVSTYSEWITTRRPLDEKPLWINERKTLDARGRSVPLVARGLIKAFKMDIGYEKDPTVKQYKDRPEYKEEKAVVIFDPTDFEFYRKNNDVIRVVNKITDTISLTEAVVKRNAYAPDLSIKARGFEANTKEFHLNEFGMISLATLDGQGRFISYVPEGDSALWTGMYVGSQAMRYLATKEKEALANVRKSVKGLLTLIDVTGNPQEFARTLALYDERSPLPEGWKRGEGPYSGIMWLQGGNNDMIKGVVHGLMWASLVIPRTETEIWAELQDKSRKIINLSIMTDKPQNRPAALGLAAYITQDPQLLQQYYDVYKSLRVKPSGFNFDTSFYWRGSADWSGVNLSMIGDINGIMIADTLGAEKIRDQLRERMMDAWVTYEAANRQLLTLASYAFAYRHGITGGNFRRESSEARFQAVLEHSVWGLREIPYPRPSLDVTIDHSEKPEWCMSPIPRLFWKAAKKPEPPIEYFYQGLQSYPFFELQAFSSSMLWKDQAFEFRLNHNKGLENPGVDYLYAYWLAKYLDLKNFD